MTREEFRAIRKSLGMRQHTLAPLLGFGSNGRVSEVERGTRRVSKVVARLMRAYADGYRPSDWPGDAP